MLPKVPVNANISMRPERIQGTSALIFHLLLAPLPLSHSSTRTFFDHCFGAGTCRTENKQDCSLFWPLVCQKLCPLGPERTRTREAGEPSTPLLRVQGCPPNFLNAIHLCREEMTDTAKQASWGKSDVPVALPWTCDYGRWAQ